MTPWVARLLIVNLIAFFLTKAQPSLERLFELHPFLVWTQPWRAVTYMFLHADFGHLFFNMLGLLLFGPRLETQLGHRRFLELYLLSGLGGAIFAIAFAPARVIGASAAVFGVYTGYARFWPRHPIYIWGVLPIQARWLIALLVFLSLYGGLGGGGDGIAHFAHLGGFVTGALYLLWIGRPSRRQRHFFEKMYGPTRRGDRVDETVLRRWKSIDRERLHEVNREYFDRVMAKLEESGVDGLSAEERAFLDRFSA